MIVCIDTSTNLYVEIGDKPFTPELKAMLRKKYHVGNDVFIPTSNIDTSVYKTDKETQDEVENLVDDNE